MEGKSNLMWAHLSHVPLRAEPSDRAECVNEVLGGETITLLERGTGNWALVRLPDGYEGWLDFRQINPVTTVWEGASIRLSDVSSAWDGVPGKWLPAGAVVRKHGENWYLGEREVRPTGPLPSEYNGDMVAWAETLLGVPYHWGGRSGWGVDCSGLVATAASLVGLYVPRDASQQFLVGVEVDAQSVRRNDVAFFKNEKGQITHVGLCMGNGDVIHASGEVRIDKLQGEHLFRHEDGVTSHDLAGIRRWEVS